MRVVLDLSTSLAWTRPPVGIVRAERKFAAFLLEQTRTEVGFCRFDRATRCHVEVSLADVRRCLGLADDAEEPAAHPLPLPDARPPGETNGRPLRLGRRARASVGAAVQRGIARLPGDVQADAALVVRSGALFVKGLYWMALRTWRSRAVGTRRVQLAPTSPPVGVEARALRLDRDDVYVSMGLDWEYNDLGALCELKRRDGFRTVLYCYDLIPVRLPHLMSFDARQPFSRYFVDLAHVADRVVAISRASLEDFRAFLLDVGAPVPPLSVIHLGTDVTHREDGDDRAPRADLAQTPFVLCVGTIEARKNHELLYNVWDRLTAMHGDRTPLLVLVGMVGWGVQDLLLRLQLNRRVADKVLILQQVADDALVWLYEHCLFTVYPSLFEGWGLPVVESMALGKPCVASSAHALTEATGGLVPTLDPLDFTSWLAHIERYAFDADALADATRRLRDYRAPSWCDHGVAMLDLIDGLTGSELCASSI